jgi:glycosyltransferase involved in cell wall biosynthesis
MVQQAIDRACSEYGPDLIHLSSPFLTRYAFPEGIPVVADAHNVEHDNVERIARIGPTVLRRAFGSALAARLRRDEPVMAARCHRILCVCERDREIFMRMVPRVPVVMVPNGVDLGHFTPTRTRREPQELIFVGTMNYPPNDEAVCWFVDRCLPLLIPRWPNIHLTVLGADPSAEVRRRASDRVRVRGRVGDIRPYLERAEVSIAPIHAGGGTRMKILEAMAMGIPVVSTPLGCEGLELADGMHLLMADSPEAFVQAVDRLLSDAILRVSLAVRARETVQARFGWDQIGHLLRCVYEGCGGIAHLQHRVEPEFVKEVTP